MYSVTDYESFDDAVDLLHELRKQELLQQTAVILVANKRDIVRLRRVEAEGIIDYLDQYTDDNSILHSIIDGKTMATRYDVKYIEVSAILNHKVDDLLAGLLQQIRLKEKRQSKLRRKNAKKWRDQQPQPALQNAQPPSQGGSSGCLHFPAPKSFVGRLLRRHPMFRSCDNLLVS